MFATDRDLLVIEPQAFARLAWLGQRVLSGTGSVSGTALTVTGATFASRGIGVGSVLLLAGVPVEVVAITGASTATVSIARAGVNDPAIATGLSGSVAVAGFTFGPQIALAHRQVMRMVGVDPDGVVPGSVVPGQVKNPREVAWLEALLALRLIYAAQATAVGHEAHMDRSLRLLDDRLRSAVGELRVLIDTDGDGLADVVRVVGVAGVVRN